MTSLFEEIADEPTVPVRRVSISVNGQRRRADIEPRLLLAHLLRQGLKLTGTHTGCDTTNCGACTVLFDGRPVKSCTMLAVEADGRAVTTIEGIAKNGEFHPMQKAFHEHHGLQCGFCTPGMVMSAIDLAATIDKPTEAQVRHWLEGNICRCTGYQNIVKAVRAGATAMQSA